MDEIEENTRCPGNAHSNSSDQLNVNIQNSVDFTRNACNSDDEVDDVVLSDEDEDDDDDDDDDDEQKGVQRIGNNELEDDEDDYGNNIQKHPKKRKLKSLLSSYELAPRLPEASIGGRNSTDDWSEHETLILLGVWGDKYVEHGRKSLRSDEWQEVADKVFQGSQIDRTDSQCRNRVDTLKKKYKKEKAKMTVKGSCFASKWVYFKKMDSLIDMNSNEEYAVTNPRDYHNCVNGGLDEERDSPGNLKSEGDSQGPSRNKTKNRKGSSCSSLFVNCVEKFRKIYEKTENNKRQRIQELEKIRMDFLIDLESQKNQIFQKGYAEIARIHGGNNDEEDGASPVINTDVINTDG